MISGTTTIPLTHSKQEIGEVIPQRLYVDSKKDYFVFKRVIDVGISVLLILFLLSWLFPIIAFLVVVGSRGPVFFVQRRVGRAGKGFRCYKFRTMIINAEADARPASTGDSRVTRIGKFLREYNVDELPQLFNVLFGHMSVVGPRPHMYSDCAAYSRIIPGYKFRTLVRPGITGLAQARGYHGPTTDEEFLQKRFQLDAYYVKNASIELDMKILYTTVSRRIELLFAKSSLF
jgi:putative colanic acid biosynthesis UDP-glucose lipid carrier transferase